MPKSAKSFRQNLRKSGVFFTPKKLSEYMRSFFPSDVAEIYDPTCGDADEYLQFLKKFELKKTTDDCYTPPAVYDTVADYVPGRCGILRTGAPECRGCSSLNADSWRSTAVPRPLFGASAALP